MPTEDEYRQASERADELSAAGRHPEAEPVLQKALDQARATVGELRRRLEERRKAEQEAREREIRLHAWRRLSGRSAHRIGNQLFASQGALRALTKLDHPDMDEPVEDLSGCLDRIRRIVQEFQGFSKNEPPKLLPASVGPLVEDVVRRYAKVDEGIELSADVTDGLPTCRLDCHQMDQAVGELLENAFHHTPADGRIVVTASLVGEGGKEKVRITVEDTGPGVPAQHKKRIFEPFVSLRPGGTGLGLAIVSQVVENHSGTIRETGKPGEGARFEIELPVQSDEESDP